VAELSHIAAYSPVVLVHGLLVSSRYLLPTAHALAPRWRVHAPDLPGYAKSGRPPRALDVPGLSDTLAGYLDVVTIPRAAVVASSFGCQVATDFAVRHPQRVERLVLLGPTVDPGSRPAVSTFLPKAGGYRHSGSWPQSAPGSSS
jgi:pimeloyl-ACP methyl ester carboxylesterase